MKVDDLLYVVIEGGGVDFDPGVLGLFNNDTLAKDCVKEAILKFLEENADESAVVVKEYGAGKTVFKIYQDASEEEYGACLNTFVIAEISSLIGETT